MSIRFGALPRPLRDDIRDGRVLPFIGAGFSLNADLPNGVMPTWTALARVLGKDLSDGGDNDSDPVDTISAYEQEHGRLHLVSRLIDLLHINQAKPGAAHLSLVRAPFEHILTTNFDLLLEEAFRSAGIAYFPTVEEGQLAIGSTGQSRMLIKVHGDIHHPDRMVLTEDDFDTWMRRNPLMATEVASLFVRRTGLLIGYSLSDPDLRHVLALLAERLGRMARPLYALVVRANASDRHRFERRGVRVVQLLSRRDGDVNSAFAALFDDMAAEMRSRSVSDLGVRRPGIGDLVPALAETAPVVFLSVPFGRLRPYRDHVFPVIERLGLIPFSGDQVPPGSDIIASIEGVIERSVAVLAEPSGDWTRTELSAALAMHRPVLVLADMHSERGQVWEPNFLSRTTSMQAHPAPQSEDDWLSFRVYLEQWLREVLSRTKLSVGSEPERLLRVGEHRAAVLSAYALLESRLRLRFAEQEGERRPLVLRELLPLAQREDVISPAELESLTSSLRLRNEVAHTGRSVSTAEATAIVRSVLQVLNRL